MSAPVLIASGGTGGHMFPALALLRELERRGQTVALVVDARGKRYVDPATPSHVVEAASPSGGALARALAMARLARGTVRCLSLMRGLRPGAAACFGGYASIPAALAARLSRVPLLVHEQNAIVGKANRLASRYARLLALSFPVTERAGTTTPILVTGNPVRSDFRADAAPYALAAWDAPLDILVLGGSQGARVFSDVLPAAMALLDPAERGRLKLTQQCRPEDLERVREAYAGLGVRAELAPFFADAAALMSRAHLVVTRSGASTVTEIMALGRPSLLVPYAHAAEDHQRLNAVQLAEAGAAIVVDQSAFDGAVLAGHLRALLADPRPLAAMAEAAHGMARPDAAERLADAVMGLMGEGRGG